MAWFGRSGKGSAAPDAAEQASAHARAQEWETALAQGRMPAFVTRRLEAASDGRVPWMATMSPAELLVAKSHGIRPLATVTGTCWLHYGRSWTEGHAEGWRTARGRLLSEAVAAGANAVVDVRMRTVRQRVHSSMDFSMIGTAVRIDGLPATGNPVLATTSALEFARLLEMGIVPVGLAIGAQFDLVSNVPVGLGLTNYGNTELRELGAFWNRVRRAAHAELRADAERQGGGVLAHTQFGQLLKVEQRDDKQPPLYLGRHIVMGTVIETPRGAKIPHDIGVVIDLRDGRSALGTGAGPGPETSIYNEIEGPI